MRTVGNLNLLIASVVLVDVESLHVIRHVIGCSRIKIPVGVAVVAAVAGVGVVGGVAGGLGLYRVVEARVAPEGVMSVDATYLTGRFASMTSSSTLGVAVAPVVVATTAAVASSVVAATVVAAIATSSVLVRTKFVFT
jgi:hypothetical protein